MDIDDDAADRIMSEIDTDGNYEDIKTRLDKRFGKWNDKRKSRFATKIIERAIELQKYEAGEITPKHTTIALKSATGVGGTKTSRYKMVRDVKGKYIGRPGNIKVVTRKGTQVWIKNIITGKTARIS